MYAVKVASTVLRRGRASNRSSLFYEVTEICFALPEILPLRSPCPLWFVYSSKLCMRSSISLILPPPFLLFYYRWFCNFDLGLAISSFFTIEQSDHTFQPVRKSIYIIQVINWDSLFFLDVVFIIEHTDIFLFTVEMQAA